MVVVYSDYAGGRYLLTAVPSFAGMISGGTPLPLLAIGVLLLNGGIDASLAALSSCI